LNNKRTKLFEMQTISCPYSLVSGNRERLTPILLFRFLFSTTSKPVRIRQTYGQKL